ncbi:MAG TPA: 3-deoxy-manno-octulosonate cytidylyltransferase [Ferruginibacter sp.]|nr:3-deoxy-manno-octulosonate cytidylyltransferase [Ferruginibacter sp.]HRO06911.1 3-deoxy-manno-octulosonate cytidylyltransferase [Ferruginibacter sp.]HRO96926.1 3-deoxy-manno-octulosonate cytidylyltransferase [Ferruginibacter sp.]HRP50024.1 3-deoxy-manno-octulosonate cytidylyltransferase [Ferruginibacter sp.]
MSALKAIAMIPARYAATRFPQKLMKMLGDKTVIRSTYENTVATELFSEVYVVTDHPLIYDEITRHGGKALMSKREHESGTDRIAEAVEHIDADVILNVQGDEPFVSATPLAALLFVFEQPDTRVASLMKPFQDVEIAHNPNVVKVVVDSNFQSLMFSRSPIPYHRDHTLPVTYYEHIGVYAFTKEALMTFTQLKPTALELIEKIECLRFLENGIPLKMVTTEVAMLKIDVPDDLEKAIDHLNKINQLKR